MVDIVTGSTSTELWHELVCEGERRAGTPLDETSESYLVFTLMRHDRDAPLAHRIMAIELLSALERGGTLGGQELRDVGDRCLLIAGLYPELANRRSVPLSYFTDLGRTAYDRLAQQTGRAVAELYQTLVRVFTRLVRVLVELRQLASERPLLDPLTRHALALDAGLDAAQNAFPGALLLPVSTRQQ